MIEIGGTMRRGGLSVICLRRYSFGSWCICSLGYSLVQILFWQLMYLQYLDIYCCRCSLGTNVSATCFSSNLQMLFSLPDMYNCICSLPFLGFEDTSFSNFTSASHVFYNLQMLSIKILHLQPALSTTCRYLPQIPFAFFLLHVLSHTWLAKKLI